MTVRAIAILRIESPFRDSSGLARGFCQLPGEKLLEIDEVQENAH
jgi:hypothetical protein